MVQFPAACCGKKSPKLAPGFKTIYFVKSYKKFFKKTVTSYFPRDSDNLMNQIDREYELIRKDIQFAESSKNPMDRRLNISAYFLSLIKVLDKRGESYENIRNISLEIAADYVQPKNWLHAKLKRLPAKLSGTKISSVLLKYLDRKISGKEHPEGFVSRIITDKKETFGLGYGVDILECGICKLFAKHNYEKYTPILCEVDYITSNLAGLELVRSGTIANGADKCDFRFKIT